MSRTATRSRSSDEAPAESRRGRRRAPSDTGAPRRASDKPKGAKGAKPPRVPATTTGPPSPVHRETPRCAAGAAAATAMVRARAMEGRSPMTRPSPSPHRAEPSTATSGNGPEESTNDDDQANQSQNQNQSESGNRRRRRRGRDRNQNQGQGGEAAPEGDPIDVEGVLDLRDDGYGFLRLHGYLPHRDDSYVSVKQVRQFGLRKGDRIKGLSRPRRAPRRTRRCCGSTRSTARSRRSPASAPTSTSSPRSTRMSRCASSTPTRSST